jgi:integration host factor subunit beta
VKKAELAKIISANNGISQALAKEILGTIQEAYLEALTVGDSIMIRGVGKLVCKRHAPRVGRNPRAGTTIHIPARMRVRFQLAKELKQALNDKLS